MFVLDTNALSAMMSPGPEPAVAKWMSSQPAEQLFTTTVSKAEIMSGLAILPHGKRRQALQSAAGAMFAEDFEERVRPFDSEAANFYAEIFATRRQAGKPIATLDLMIAAIARSHGAGVVTREVGGFEGCGLTLINPWTLG